MHALSEKKTHTKYFEVSVSEDMERSAPTWAVTLACTEEPHSPTKVSFPNQKP